MSQTPITPADSALQSNLPRESGATTTAHDGATPSTRARTAAMLLLVAAVTAIPFELLLRIGPRGLNVPLMAITVGGALLYLTRSRDRERLPIRVALVAAMVMLASIVAWRSESLLWLAAVAGVIGTCFVLVMPRAGWLRNSEPFRVVVDVAAGVLQTLTGPLRLAAGDLDWRAVTAGGGSSSFGHLRGLLGSIVVVLPFLLLFAEADAVFAAHTRELIDLPLILSHVVLWGVSAWLGAGWLGTGLLPWPRHYEVRVRVSAPEATWVLGALSLAFAAFVAVQLRYFFAGVDLVAEVTGLTYAEYARRGFFELVTVAALLLVVLLVADETTRDEDAAGQRRVRGLSVLLLGLLGVVLVSALQRMRLYVEEYGLTELRFFTTAFMLWLVVVFCWYAATVLRGARQRFIGGVYVSGVAAVLLLAAIDPIARITRFNVEHAERTSRFDQAHALSLGADAVPVLAASLERLPVANRCPVAVGMVWRWAEPPAADADWRAWNRSRSRAHEIVQAERQRFESLCGRIEAGRSTR